MSVDQAVLNAYYKKVGKALHCRKKEEKQILANLKCDVEDYVRENPDLTEAQLYERFGKPEEYANAYLATLSGDELRKKVSRSRFGFRFWLIAAIVMILLFIFGFIGIIIYNHHHSAQFYSEEITYIVPEKIYKNRNPQEEITPKSR